MNKEKVLYYILDFIFLMLSYLLCDFISSKSNIFIGICVGLISYLIVFYLLSKIFIRDK